MRLKTLWVADHIAYSTLEHNHDFYQICYCTKAGGSFVINKKYYTAIENHVYFIKPMELHSMLRGQDMRLVEIKFVTTDDSSTEVLSHIPEHFELEDSPVARMIMRQIIHESKERSPYSQEAVDSALQYLMIKTVRYFLDEGHEKEGLFAETDRTERKSDITSSENRAQFEKLLTYIEEHYAEEITLDLLAEQVHFNKSYMIELFKSNCGTSPMKYLQWIRLERAKEYLRFTDLHITEIAEKTGFNSIYYFCRCFREHEKMTAQRYRYEFSEKE